MKQGDLFQVNKSFIAKEKLFIYTSKSISLKEEKSLLILEIVNLNEKALDLVGFLYENGKYQTWKTTIESFCSKIKTMEPNNG